MIAMSRKRQRDVGRFEAMKYFEKEGKMDKLTWLVSIFDNVKAGGRGRSREDGATSSHLDTIKYYYEWFDSDPGFT